MKCDDAIGRVKVFKNKNKVLPKLSRPEEEVHCFAFLIVDEICGLNIMTMYIKM